MEQKLKALQQALARSKTDTNLLKYEFFDANLMPELKGAELFDFPVFLIFSDAVDSDFTHVIVYNILDRRFHIILCRSVWKVTTPSNHKEMYALHILKELEDQALAGEPVETAAWITSRRV
jgi:arginine-tRNA-protein transferase